MRKQRPQAANCQLRNTLDQNVRFQPNGAMRIRANFKNTWPAVSNKHCSMMRGRTLYIEL